MGKKMPYIKKGPLPVHQALGSFDLASKQGPSNPQGALGEAAALQHTT